MAGLEDCLYGVLGVSWVWGLGGRRRKGGGEGAHINKVRLHKRLLNVALVVVIAELAQDRVQHGGVDEVLEFAVGACRMGRGGSDHVQPDRSFGWVE